MTPTRYVISFRPSLQIEDFASFSKSLVSALEQSLPCVSIKIRVFEIVTEPSVRAIVAARLAVPMCLGIHSLCKHADPVDQAAADNLLVREISAFTSEVHSGPFRRLFEAAAVVPADSSLHDSLASKIQRSWKRSKQVESPSLVPAVPLNPWPSALRRDEAAKTVQRAWRGMPETSVEGDGDLIDLKLAIRDSRSPQFFDHPTSSSWGLRRDLRPRFHATRRSENAIFSFDRREAEIVSHFRSGSVTLEQESRSFDFEISEFPFTREPPSFRVGFGTCKESWLVSTEIPSSEIRVGRVFQVRLIDTEISSFFFLGVFCQGRLVAPAARALGNLSEIFCHGTIEFQGKIRLVSDPSHPLTMAQMQTQIEQSGNSFFFARPENLDDVSDVIHKISALTRDVEANVRRIEELSIFQPERGERILDELPVKRNSISVPRLGLPSAAAAPTKFPIASNLADSSNDEKDPQPKPRRSSPAQPPPKPQAQQLRSPYREAESARTLRSGNSGPSVFTDPSVFSASARSAAPSEAPAAPRKSRRSDNFPIAQSKASVGQSLPVPVAPERKGVGRQQPVKNKISNKRESSLQMKKLDDEESSSWSDLFASEGEEGASSEARASGSVDAASSSSWF